MGAPSGKKPSTRRGNACLGLHVMALNARGARGRDRTPRACALWWISRAVRTEKAQDLATPHLEPDVISAEAAEALGQLLDFDQGRLDRGGRSDASATRFATFTVLSPLARGIYPATMR